MILKMSKEEFECVRNDERLACLISLARAVNSINFCIDVGKDTIKENDCTKTQNEISEETKNYRKIINSFFILNGFLYEALKIVDSLGKYYNDTDYYKVYLSTINKGEEVKEYKEKILKKIRSHIAFHFCIKDNKENNFISDTLRDLKIEKYIFATFFENSSEGVYFNLADEVVTNYLFDKDLSPDQEMKEVYNWSKKSGAIAKEFVENSSKFLYCAAKDLKWSETN